MAIFLGIDGGGTGTSCLIGDEKSELGSGRGGASNVLRVGEAEARISLLNAIQETCSGARIDPAQVTRTCVGVAGAARPEVAEMVREIVAEIVSGEIEIVGDMVIALHAAFGEGPGIVVIAGTGSIAYGRNLEGKTARAGGLGFASSDEGSGHWIGRAAIAAALQNADENPAPESTLLRSLMKAWKAETRDARALAANASPPPDFAVLFPAVLATASSGDGLAAEVLRQAGSELATLAKVVISRLFSGPDPVPVAMCGGVFRNSALVRKTFYNELRSQCPQVAIQEKIEDPVLGALDLARSGFR
jgi:N-acetylglucosamine kinase-like BadF-type ATPase